MAEPRAFTPEEVRAKVLDQIAALAVYWSKTGKDPLDACNGLAFSILNMIDGSSLDLPGFLLIPCPHEEDAEHHRECGENWFNGSAINDDASLHELWHRHQRSA